MQPTKRAVPVENGGSTTRPNRPQHNRSQLRRRLRTSKSAPAAPEAARDGILILDATSLRITDVNPFMTELLGYSRDQFLGRELWEIGFFSDKEASQEAFQELQANGYLRYEDLPLQTIEGKLQDVEFVSNVYEEDGHQVIQCISRIKKQAARRTQAAIGKTQAARRRLLSLMPQDEFLALLYTLNAYP